MVNLLETMKINFPISGTRIFIPFKAVCSLSDMEFSGKIIVEYHPKSLVLEYADLENFINKISKKKLTAEDMVNFIFKEVEKSISPKYLKVLIDVEKTKAHKPVQVWRES